MRVADEEDEAGGEEEEAPQERQQQEGEELGDPLAPRRSGQSCEVPSFSLLLLRSQSCSGQSCSCSRSSAMYSPKRLRDLVWLRQQFRHQQLSEQLWDEGLLSTLLPSPEELARVVWGTRTRELVRRRPAAEARGRPPARVRKRPSAKARKKPAAQAKQRPSAKVRKRPSAADVTAGESDGQQNPEANGTRSEDPEALQDGQSRGSPL